MDENPLKQRVLIDLRLSVVCIDQWTHSVTVPAPPCPSTAQETVTSRKDVGVWSEAMIECALNTSRSSVRELPFMNRLPGLRLTPLAAAWALINEPNLIGPVETSTDFISACFVPLVWNKDLQENSSDQFSRCCVLFCAQVLRRTWFICIVRRAQWTLLSVMLFRLFSYIHAV